MIKIIAAVSLNNVIGIDNKLPWPGEYSDDLKFFRTMTTEQTIIMGSQTFHSIGRPLPKRRNLVLSRKMTPKLHPEVEQFHSLEDALVACNNDCWIIGGGQIYSAAMNLADQLYITEIPRVIQGTNVVYFPEINLSKFKLIKKIPINEDKKLYSSLYEKIQR